MQSRIMTEQRQQHTPQQGSYQQRVTPRKVSLSQLVLGLCPTHNNQHIRQNQMIRKLKENYLAHWKESTKKLSKLSCFLSLNRGYTVAEYLTTVTDPKRRKFLTRYRLSEHSLAMEKGRHRQTAHKTN